ncbi:MAG: thioredoxin, partial [Acidimicrobiia bacterium]|nr:thioredoxin [Acidimicrobiia bacterium]
MIITCPSCTTYYSVAPAAIGSGKTVRCHNCNHSWHQIPVAETPPPSPQARGRMPRARAVPTA